MVWAGETRRTEDWSVPPERSELMSIHGGHALLERNLGKGDGWTFCSLDLLQKASS